MSEATAARTCRYPDCDRPAATGDPGVGRPPEYCGDPEHNRASAWRARQRRGNTTTSLDQARPVDAARQRASVITAQVTGMSEHLVSQLQDLLEQLRTVGDVGAAEAEIEAVTSDAAEQIAAANARAVRAEQALRQAIADTEEADAAATEATARADASDTALAQARAELEDAYAANEQLRAAHKAVTAELAQARTEHDAAQEENRRLTGELAQARSELHTAQQQAQASDEARAAAEQQAATAREIAQTEAGRTRAAEHTIIDLRRQIEQVRADLDGARERAAELRATQATLTAQRDAARADIERERAHGDQRVKDLHETYTHQMAELRTALSATASTQPRRVRARKTPQDPETT